MFIELFIGFVPEIAPVTPEMLLHKIKQHGANLAIQYRTLAIAVAKDNNSIVDTHAPLQLFQTGAQPLLIPSSPEVIAI